jgi:hypothetical protein
MIAGIVWGGFFYTMRRSGNSDCPYRGWVSPVSEVGWTSLELSKELRVNRDILDLPHAAVDAKLVLLEQVAELVPVDQVDGRRPVARGLALGFGGEGAGRDQQALLAAPAHRAAEVAHRAGADAADVTLALEEYREAEQRHPVDPDTVDPAVSGFAGDRGGDEPSLAQEPPSEALELIWGDVLEG